MVTELALLHHQPMQEHPLMVGLAPLCQHATEECKGGARHCGKLRTTECIPVPHFPGTVVGCGARLPMTDYSNFNS
ncbi:UNVERIFIED_CONTAM: hypothetical protein K2H54_003327 [Gekko kuhli]